jgi:glycosyltransferase involved in cell wall biosynthesis
MHVLILCQGFPPANLTSGRRSYHLAKRLVDRGHEVSVICEHIATLDQWPADLTGIAVHRLHRITVPKDAPWTLKIIYLIYTWFGRSALLRPIGELWGDVLLPTGRKARLDLDVKDVVRTFVRPDVIIASGPPWNYFEYARDLAHAWRIPFCLDYRDPWNIRDRRVALSLFDRRKGLRGWLVRIRQSRAERSIGRLAALITAATPGVLSNARSVLGMASGHVVLNGSPMSAPPTECSGDTFVMTYTGMLYEEQEWSLVRDGLELLAREHPDLCTRLQVRFIGPAPTQAPRAFLQVIRSINALPFVWTHGRMGRIETLHEQSRSDLLLHVGFKGKFGILPLKFLEYIGSGKPVLQVSTGRDLPEEILEKTRTGYVVSNAREMVDRITSLMERKRTGSEPDLQPDPIALSAYHWDASMDTWIDRLEALQEHTVHGTVAPS